MPTDADVRHPSEAEPALPWPFPNDEFPERLGVAVHRLVLRGRRPALQVIHGEDGVWGIADGIDEATDDKLEFAHIWHVIEHNPSIAALAALPPGHQADRRDIGEPWVTSAVGSVIPAVGLAQRIRAAARRLLMPANRTGW